MNNKGNSLIDSSNGTQEDTLPIDTSSGHKERYPVTDSSNGEQRRVGRRIPTGTPTYRPTSGSLSFPIPGLLLGSPSSYGPPCCSLLVVTPGYSCTLSITGIVKGVLP